MTAFDQAKRFFEACETPAGWEGCKPFVAKGATFTAQSEPLTDIHDVEGYCEWMKAFGTVTAPGASYTLNSTAYDEASRTALFFATYHARHSGEGGPVPATGRQTHSDYVYAVTMGDDDRVTHMTKIWNAPWAMRELGWLGD